MTKAYFHAITVAVAILVASHPRPTSASDPIDDATQVAQEAIAASLSSLVNSDNHALLGFDSAGDASDGTLEPPTGGVSPEEVDRLAAEAVPIREAVIPLNEIQNLDPNTPPLSLLDETRTVHFPIWVGNGDVPRSAVTVALVPHATSPKLVGFGMPNLTRIVVQIRFAVVNKVNNADSMDLDLSPSETRLVRIPALNIDFIGFCAPGNPWPAPGQITELTDCDLHLAPILRDPRFPTLTPGVDKNWHDILAPIQGVAILHNGKPT